MTSGLKRHYGLGHLHYITCSCYGREPLLQVSGRYLLLLKGLEVVRERYAFRIAGYVLMPEHFHLLMSEPEKGDPSQVMFALKQTFARRVMRQDASLEQFWQKRFYDFNVYTRKKMVEKIRYMHNNPVVRSLAASPTDWPWSSARYYMHGDGIVKIEFDEMVKSAVPH
jgi:putative transposase